MLSTTHRRQRLTLRKFLSELCRDSIGIWRREWDSNPRHDCSYTHFPSVRRELCGMLNLSSKQNPTVTGSPPSTCFEINLSPQNGLKTDRNLNHNWQCSVYSCRLRVQDSKEAHLSFKFETFPRVRVR